MCWNAQVSLQTFLIGVIGIIVGVQYGLSLPVAFFCLSISLMQLIEYFVWSYYDNKSVNYYASVAASLLLWIQPIASITTLSSPHIRNSMLLAYGALSVLGQLFERKTDYSMTRAPNGHLAWNWIQKDALTYASLVVYMIFLFVPIFLNKNYGLLTLALGTLGISLYSYWKANTWGSMWCWIVNGIVLLTSGQAVIANSVDI